jgi:hypothetical protein
MQRQRFSGSQSLGFTEWRNSNHKPNPRHLMFKIQTKSLLIGAAALGLGLTAQAQTTTVDIVGATAFRAAAHQSIMAAFGNGLSAYAHSANATQASSADRVTYKGTFPGVTGTTVIRVSWTGSVEGVRSLASSRAKADEFIPESAAVGSNGAEIPNTSTKVLGARTAVMAFSDVAQVNTPFKTPALKGGPIGVIAFAPVINKGAEAEITNITANQFRRLLSSGSIPESMLTGNTTSNGTIYLLGRNDGSGTRVAHLMEVGHGAPNPVRQFVINATTSISSLALPVLAPTTENQTLYPRYVLSTDFARTAIAGNGGYQTGRVIAEWMRFPSSGDFNIVSWLGTPDASRAYNSGNGGRVLAYNGERLDGLATTGSWTEADRNKVRLGKYSAWNFENLYTKGDLKGSNKVVYETLVASIPGNIGSAGVASDSSFKVTRSTDGGVIAPK